MQSTSTPKGDRTAEVVPAIAPSAPWRVVSVETLSGMRLRDSLVDGTSGEVELGRFLGSDDVRGTIFEQLRSGELFTQARVVDGVVEWPNGADLAPDAMYDAIRQSGRWVLS